MELRETLKSAIQALRINALRSSLTMLGIIIGITAVILISSVGQGTVAFISNELTSFGTNFFSINPGNNFISTITGGGEPLTTADIEAIKDANIPNIENIAAFSYTSKVVSADEESKRTSVYGMTPEAQEMLKPDLIYGEFLSEDDSNNRVVVLGSDVVEDLFGKDTNPVGESVKIDDIRFVVIGVSKSGGSLFGSFFNTAVNIPLGTLQNQITGNDEINEIDIGVRNIDLLNETMDEVELVLRDHRHISDMEENDFVLQSFEGALDTFETITTLLTVFITGISAISLLVGGVGVMNIMLVSVTERTKEIGLLKAIGAKRKDILTQFLIESAVMTTIGGFAGIILGLGGTFLISVTVGIPFIISVPWILLGVGISTLVGLVFGIYPARKAADLLPIDALRYE
ncbi:MAG: ABC transporter permease [Candidatus Daviesbacteria bacterium]|nr:ABC transporter permease [Candidatus Daviesbacteria bacterium]